jgi:hypothetical protein
MGWSNAHIDVENAKLGLGWAVTDDNTGNPEHYATLITVTLPDGIIASIGKKAPNETVVLNRSTSLTHGPAGIQISAAYQVSARTGATGKQVAVKIATVAGQKAAATGDILGEGGGQVGQVISVDIVVPVS